MKELKGKKWEIISEQTVGTMGKDINYRCVQRMRIKGGSLYLSIHLALKGADETCHEAMVFVPGK